MPNVCCFSFLAQSLQTSVPGIYAAGDVASFKLLIEGGKRIRQEHVQNGEVMWFFLLHFYNYSFFYHNTARETGKRAALSILAADKVIDNPPGPYDYLPYFYSRELDFNWKCYGVQRGTAHHFGEFRSVAKEEGWTKRCSRLTLRSVILSLCSLALSSLLPPAPLSTPTARARPLALCGSTTARLSARSSSRPPTNSTRSSRSWRASGQAWLIKRHWTAFCGAFCRVPPLFRLHRITHESKPNP